MKGPRAEWRASLPSLPPPRTPHRPFCSESMLEETVQRSKEEGLVVVVVVDWRFTARCQVHIQEWRMVLAKSRWNFMFFFFF